MAKHSSHGRKGASPAPAAAPPQDPVTGTAPEPGRPTRRLSRRRLIGLAATGGVAVAAVAVAESPTTLGRADADTTRPRIRTSHHPTGTASTTETLVPTHATETTTRSADGVPLPTSQGIVAENAKPGHLWWVTSPQAAGDIEGYASQVSAVAGDTVTLFVNTRAASFHVEAYRMGYYGGVGGRLVWQSAEVAGGRQPPPTLMAFTNTIECHWTPSLTVPVDGQWPPGAYLLKLVGATGEQQFVPLCVRDDASRAAFVIQHSVSTWQAYNRWGGYSLYYGNRNGALSYTHNPTGATFADRSRIVSYDRPYDHDWASGAADFVGNEFPLIYQAEQLGLDVTYWTDVDLHARPELLGSHRALISLGHDEYWSAEMRDGATQAVASGVNLAFLGANACYRQVRFEPSPLGVDRHQVCYKSAAEDPMSRVDPALVTVNWPQPPVSRPEAQLIGSTYQDIGAHADMVVTDTSSWALAGVDLPIDHRLPGAVQGEFDRYVPQGGGPANLDVIAHSVVPNRGGNYSDVTWYTAPGGGGVFATGNASWVGQLSDSPLVPPNVVPAAAPGVTAPLLRIMQNVYSVIGSGPASLTHPSQGNWALTYAPGSSSAKAPDTVNAA